MEISIFLAKVWGLCFVIVSLAMLLNKKSFNYMVEISRDKIFIYTGGFLSLTIGLLSVIAHNIWTGELWIILVTIFGWGALLKGMTRLFFPDTVIKICEKFKDNSNFAYFFLTAGLILGLYTTYMGFWG